MCHWVADPVQHIDYVHNGPFNDLRSLNYASTMVQGHNTGQRLQNIDGGCYFQTVFPEKTNVKMIKPVIITHF